MSVEAFGIKYENNKIEAIIVSEREDIINLIKKYLPKFYEEERNALDTLKCETYRKWRTGIIKLSTKNENFFLIDLVL